MNFIDYKISILLPYKKLYDISKSIVENMGVNMIVAEVNSFNVIDTAKRCRDTGAEIIISRGGIGKRIEEELKVKVVNIDITAQDIMKTLYKYRDTNKCIAVVENRDFIKAVMSVNEILNIDIKYYKVDKIEDFKKRVDEAINDDMKIIIGGSWGYEDMEYILSHNILYDIIESDKNSVDAAIDKACNLYTLTMDERAKKQMLKTVIDFSTNGIVSVDSKGTLNSVNPLAEKILNVKEQDVIGKDSRDYIKDINFIDIMKNKTVIKGIIKNIGNKKIVVNEIPIIVDKKVTGAIATFEEVSNILSIEEKLRFDLAEKGLKAKYNFKHIIGKCELSKQVINLAKTYSKTSSTILITGETGVGKEVFAQAIHNNSNRKSQAFVGVNCSALPENLLESELFGYVEGAFTGAVKGGKMGLFELAHNGTIFLDEIGEINKNTQARLLRVLQERQVMRIGANKVIPIDIRVIAATNKNLHKEVLDGNFRQDLYYRLNVLNINIPSLKERREDIPLLIENLIEKINMKLNCNVTTIDNEIMNILVEHSWPGNIRELENVLEKIVVLTKTGIAQFSQVKFILKEIMTGSKEMCEIEHKDIYSLSLKEAENEIILRALSEEQYNKTKAAQRLGIDRTTLNRKLKYIKTPH